MAYEGTFIEGVGSDPFLTLNGGREDYAAQNAGITPVFYMEPVLNETKTADAGRPIYDDQESIRIFIAGDLGTQICSPVMDTHRERFHEAYSKWKAKNDGKEYISGTPLRSWPAITSAQVAEFEAIKIFNVEGLASLSEHAMQRYSGSDLRKWQAKAKAWIDSADSGAGAMKLAEENLRMKDDIAELRKSLTDMKAQMEASDLRRRKRQDEAA